MRLVVTLICLLCLPALACSPVDDVPQGGSWMTATDGNANTDPSSEGACPTGGQECCATNPELCFPATATCELYATRYVECGLEGDWESHNTSCVEGLEGGKNGSWECGLATEELLKCLGGETCDRLADGTACLAAHGAIDEACERTHTGTGAGESASTGGDPGTDATSSTGSGSDTDGTTTASGTETDGGSSSGGSSGSTTASGR